MFAGLLKIEIEQGKQIPLLIVSPTLGGTKHTKNKANALAQSNKADHGRNDDGQQAHDLVEDTGQHGAGHDAGQSGSGSNDFLKATLLSL